jgi:hypothetical protein
MSADRSRRLDQLDPAQDQCAHDSLTQIGLGNHQRAQLG